SMIDPLMYLGRYEEALALADVTRETLIAHNEKILLAQLETNVGNLYYRTDQYHQALECYDRARAVFAEAEDHAALAFVSLNSANVYMSLDDFRQAQEAYQRAYEHGIGQKMDLVAAQGKYSIGYIHFLKGEYHQALRALHEVSHEFERLGDE